MEVLPKHLEPSELGTQEYWNSFYENDLCLEESDPSAPLTGWFEDVNASEKIVQYLQSSSLQLDRRSTSFIDLGTGNGELLFLLREEAGFTGRMLGIDYSQQSIELCRKLAQARCPSDSMEEGIPGIAFEICDIMNHDLGQQAGVVLDKGTFDAISLSDARDDRGRRICEGYRERVEVLIEDGGLLLVTSCNWTEAELKTWFLGSDSSLHYEGRIEYRTFSFGGKIGQSVCTICFRKGQKKVLDVARQ